MNVIQLNPETISAVADAVVSKMRNTPVNDTIFTTRQAADYTGRRSIRAFTDWKNKWGVKSTIKGRYSRQQLDKGLDRERRGEIRG